MADDNPQPQARPDWVGVLCGVCRMDWHIKRNAGRTARVGKELREAGGTVEEVTQHYGTADTGAAWWWYRDDWRGKKGQAPMPEQIVETWGRWQMPVAVNLPTKYASIDAWAQTGNSHD